MNAINVIGFAQRSSPQFSIAQAGSSSPSSASSSSSSSTSTSTNGNNNNQFGLGGSDIFVSGQSSGNSAGNQNGGQSSDVSSQLLAQLQSLQASNSFGNVQSGSQIQSLPASSSSPTQSQSAQSQSQSQSASQHISVPRSARAQQQQQQQAQPSSASSNVKPQRPQQSLSSQQHGQTQNHAHSHHQNTQHHHQHQQPNNLHGLQTQQTSQSIHNQNNPGAQDLARRADAQQASLAAAAGQPYKCPDSFGFFRHHKSCDKYWACDNSTGVLKMCGNGLNFDDSDPKRENCAYPFSVDCADRTELEAPISTPHCPRLYGLFPDTTNCRVFFSCWNGESSRYECPPGLAYDSEQRVCVWADLVERCDQSEVSDGFVCPDATEVDQPGHYTRHAHPTDCRKFYVCIEGVARPYGCSLGTVFNVDSLQCDEPENVGGCEKYYGETEPKVAKKQTKEQAKIAAISTSSSSTSSNSAGRQSSSSQQTQNSNH